MSSIRIEPQTNRVWCKYTLIEPVSHHDPGQADQSNFSMYRRQRRWIKLDAAGEQITQAQINLIAQTYPVPIEIADWFVDEPISRFVAICLAEQFIKAYGGRGFGLFEGVARYRRLEDRMAQTATRVGNLKSFWSVLTKEMKVPPRGSAFTHSLMPLLVQPSAFATEVLYQFAKHSQLVRMLAQTWREQERLSDAEYAKKAKKPQSSGQHLTLSFEADTADPPEEVSVALPVHSGNDIRHDIRQSLMYHLLHRLDLTFDDTLPLHVRTLLENGGALSGAQPDNAFQRQQIIVKNYPHLALLGGCMPNYMLGESRLQSVGAFLKGRENNEALAEIGIKSNESVVDLLDLWTLTRHSTLTEEDPLPYEFEVIQPGAELYVRFGFHPFTRDIELGAFGAAMQTFADTENAIGGQTAQGFGRVNVEYLQIPDDLLGKADIYEQHLAINKENLRAWLLDGSLGVE